MFYKMILLPLPQGSGRDTYCYKVWQIVYVLDLKFKA